MLIVTPDAELEVEEELPFALLRNSDYLRYLLEKRNKGNALPVVLTDADHAVLNRLLRRVRNVLPTRPQAIAPIRTKPERTYDPTRDTPEPEGRHVPMVLARAFRGKEQDAQAFAAELSKFGRACGLFDEIHVKRLGQSESSPFQLQVKIAGPAFNLVDVGYGVSQVLPVLVDCLMSKSGQAFLLQQPEVHLHPRAQAELGSFLGTLVRREQKRFIVESHSDYLIDRICMDVRDGGPGRVRPDDVAILYFERDGAEVTIHHLRIDEAGEIVGAPPSYRRFFLQEERRLLLGAGK
jgi:hypothetical protein